MAKKIVIKKIKDKFIINELDQFDNESGDYNSLDDIPKKYSENIGYFFIVFSSLEHVVNLITADMISDRAHDMGYRILSSLTMNSKIDFLSKIILSYIKVTNQKNDSKLKELQKRLLEVNAFRNYLAHANWGTLKLDGSVRTKIIIGNDDGQIKFRCVKITPKIITKKIKEVNSLMEELDTFFMDIMNAN